MLRRRGSVRVSRRSSGSVSRGVARSCVWADRGLVLHRRPERAVRDERRNQEDDGPHDHTPTSVEPQPGVSARLLGLGIVRHAQAPGAALQRRTGCCWAPVFSGVLATRGGSDARGARCNETARQSRLSRARGQNLLVVDSAIPRSAGAATGATKHRPLDAEETKRAADSSAGAADAAAERRMGEDILMAVRVL